MVTVLRPALPAAGQDEVKARLASWDDGAIRPYVIPAIGGSADAFSGEVTYAGVVNMIAGHAREAAPPERSGLTFRSPVIDATGAQAGLMSVLEKSLPTKSRVSREDFAVA